MSDDYAKLRAALTDATAGPWGRITEGNANVEQIGHKLLHDLLVRLADGTPPSTDATYVVAAGRNIAFIGNGPRQTENGDYIAAANPSVIAALLADHDRLDELARQLLDENHRLTEALREAVGDAFYRRNPDYQGEDIVESRAYGPDAVHAEEPDKRLLDWVAHVRVLFQLDKATGNKDYWDGYKAAVDDVERLAIATPQGRP